MKQLFILCLMSTSLSAFSQASEKADSAFAGYNTNAKTLIYTFPVTKRDTVCEWMHLSISQRHNSIVLLRKALTVQVNGKCVQHLYANGRKFPIHYHVGWCEGKEKLFNRLIVN